MMHKDDSSPNNDEGKTKAKKVVLFLKIGLVKTFYHLPAGISQMCMRIYIFCFKKTHTNKKNSASKFIRTNLRFFRSNNKR